MLSAAILFPVRAAVPSIVDYESDEKRRRRWPRIVLITVLALAAGTAGKLCWDRFAQPLRQHFAALAAQHDISRGVQAEFRLQRISDGESVWINLNCNRVGNDLQELPSTWKADLPAVDAFEQTVGASHRGMTLWVGQLTNQSGRRIVILRMFAGSGTNPHRPVLLASVYRPGSLFSAVEPLGSPQLFELTTPADHALWGKAEIAGDDPSVVSIPESIDERPGHVRFRLTDLDHLMRLPDE